jgi:hypothetical protein
MKKYVTFLIRNTYSSANYKRQTKTQEAGKTDNDDAMLATLATMDSTDLLVLSPAYPLFVAQRFFQVTSKTY